MRAGSVPVDVVGTEIEAHGARVTPETLTRVNDFMAKHGAPGAGEAPPELMPLIHAGAPQRSIAPVQKADPETNFRFFDNRQKYLLFVNTCSEKDVIARRVGLELGQIHPRPPAVRLFDAGMGDGTVLARVMREMHRRFPTVPFYIVGKEISLEDVRLSLRKMADRFYEHPATVLVVTNMYYSEAPWLQPRAVTAATTMVWHEAALTGITSHDFSEQIAGLEPFLARSWQARHSPKSGNPVYEHPTALILSGALMLRHLGEVAAAARVEDALREVIAEGRATTYDLGGTAGTSDMADAIVARLDGAAGTAARGRPGAATASSVGAS